MARNVGKIGLALLGSCLILAGAAFIGGRVLRANAPEMAFIRGDRDVYALDIERGFVRLLAHTDLGLTHLKDDLCLSKGFKPLVREPNCVSPVIMT